MATTILQLAEYRLGGLNAIQPNTPRNPTRCRKDTCDTVLSSQTLCQTCAPYLGDRSLRSYAFTCRTCCGCEQATQKEPEP